MPPVTPYIVRLKPRSSASQRLAAFAAVAACAGLVAGTLLGVYLNRRSGERRSSVGDEISFAPTAPLAGVMGDADGLALTPEPQ